MVATRRKFLADSRNGVLALGLSPLWGQPTTAWAKNDPLPSWNETAPKAAITSFVDKVTKEGSAEFVPEPERIAVFDNDGTLWVEHPMYAQLAFALDRVKTLAPQHPEWNDIQPFKAVLEGDLKTLSMSGEKGLLDIIMQTHAGMTRAISLRADYDYSAAIRMRRGRQSG